MAMTLNTFYRPSVVPKGNGAQRHTDFNRRAVSFMSSAQDHRSGPRGSAGEPERGDANLLRVTIRGIGEPHKLNQPGATPGPATNFTGDKVVGKLLEPVCAERDCASVRVATLVGGRLGEVRAEMPGALRTSVFPRYSPTVTARLTYTASEVFNGPKAIAITGQFREILSRGFILVIAVSRGDSRRGHQFMSGEARPDVAAGYILGRSGEGGVHRVIPQGARTRPLTNLP